MYDIIKVLSVLAYPLGVTVLLGLAGSALGLCGKPRAALAAGSIALVWLWAWSMPVTSERLRLGLETRYPNLPIEQNPAADAILVLGGAFSTNEAWPYPNASGSVDRYWHGARLYHAGLADRVVLTGGGSPRRPDRLTEAEAGSMFLRDMGVPLSAIILDTQSRTTRDHVVLLDSILRENGIERLLLVTSATHMRRSEAVFAQAGFHVIPVATDFSVGQDGQWSVRSFLPSADALSNSTRVVHEYLGYWFYRLLGWI